MIGLIVGKESSYSRTLPNEEVLGVQLARVSDPSTLITRICCGLRPITLSPLRSTYAAPIVLVTFNACLPTLCRAQPLLEGSLSLEFPDFYLANPPITNCDFYY